MATPFTLEAGGWYAMTMYPGYAREPYRSPVEVHRLVPLGNRRFDLTFYNIGYASGAQLMEKTLRTLHRHQCALITQDEQMKERNLIFEPLTMAWITAYAPGFGTMMIEALPRPCSLSTYRAQE